MNKKHTFKIGKYISMACLVFVCATVQSCRDEYTYDDREPEWLGASIYEYLESEGNFKYFMKVIEDLNYKEVLSKTGSKTLFVADDEAFMNGIKEEWGFDSYEQLTPAHKRIILYNAMLDNAYLLELMSNMPAANEKSEPVIGRCLRQVTSSQVTDSIGFFTNEDLPQNNKDWDFLRDKGVRLALDATQTTMVHFLEEQLYQNQISMEDVNIMLNHRYNATRKDAFIFDKMVIDQNVTCKNGYVHQLDGLLIPPSNMAEEIRTNGETEIYSSMLDRFSVPTYNSSVTADYNRIYHYGDDANAEYVYEKRYWTSGSRRGSASGQTDEEKGFLTYVNPLTEVEHRAVGSLYYDPGWNEYRPGVNSSTTKENDMAVMFAPSDAALTEYFTHGEGEALIERYGRNVPDKFGAGLRQAIDSIPLTDLQYLMRNMMKNSFNSAVPSRFPSIMDDARDPMGVTTDHIEKCIIANNGLVYVTNKVYSPARYVAVTAPVMLSDTLKIANWAINRYEYDKYLLSMGSTFSLVVPSDGCMKYLDPSSLREGQEPTMYVFKWNEKGNEAGKVYAETWLCDPITLDTIPGGKKDNLTNSTTIENLLRQMYEYYIVVGDFTNGNKYHMAKSYGTIKVDVEDGEVKNIYGGYQVQNNQTVPMGHIYNQKNGNTYRLDAGMIQPATQSVYKVLSDSENHPGFSKFFELCQGSSDVLTTIQEGMKLMDADPTIKTNNDVDSIFNTLGYSADEPNEIKKDIFTNFKSDLKKVCQTSETKKDDIIKPEDYIDRYAIFENLNGMDYNVRTFNTYHYTVYVPENEDIDRAYNLNLPTWDELIAESELVNTLMENKLAKEDELSETTETTDPAIIEALNAEIAAIASEIYARTIDLTLNVISVTNFVKYHFQDNSVYVDNLPHSIIEGNEVKYVVDYETATLDEITKRFCTVQVKTEGNTIAVKGDIEGIDNTCYVITDGIENQDYNIMTRDIEFKKGAKTIETSSYAVVHQIDDFLVNDRIFDSADETFIKFNAAAQKFTKN